MKLFFLSQRIISSFLQDINDTLIMLVVLEKLNVLTTTAIHYGTDNELVVLEKLNVLTTRYIMYRCNNIIMSCTA